MIGDKLWYVGRYPYQLWHFRKIRDRLGGGSFLPGMSKEVYGVIVFANHVHVSPHKDIARVFHGHGTSNKPLKLFMGDKGKHMFDYYWTSGPKYSAAIKGSGHGITEENEAKIGNLRWDWYYNGPQQKVREKFGFQNSLETVLFAPTYARHTFETYFNVIEELLKTYNVIARPHPMETVTTNCPHRNFRLASTEEDMIEWMYDVDILITDESSVAYDFLITGKPIVLTICQAEHTFDDADDKHNLQMLAPVFRWWESKPPEIYKCIEQARGMEKEFKQMAENCFWQVDGYAADRACDWIEKTIGEKWPK